MKRRKDGRRRGVKDKMWTKKDRAKGDICIFKIGIFPYSFIGRLFNLTQFAFWSCKIIIQLQDLNVVLTVK